MAAWLAARPIQKSPAPDLQNKALPGKQKNRMQSELRPRASHDAGFRAHPESWPLPSLAVWLAGRLSPTPLGTAESKCRRESANNNGMAGWAPEDLSRCAKPRRREMPAAARQD